MPDFTEYLTECYEGMLRLQPVKSGCKVHVHPDVAKAMAWTNGQSLTKYNLTVAIDNRIKESDLGNGVYQSDIWVLNG